MCDTCSVDPAEVERLIHEELADEDGFLATDVDPDGLESTNLDDAEEAIDRARPVWISAGSTASGAVEGHHTGAPTMDVSVRAAISHLARVLFDRETSIPIVLRWEPDITPQLLDAASRFGAGTATLVWVFVPSFGFTDVRELLSFADWSRGRVVQVKGRGVDVARSALAHRELRGAVFLGGGSEVDLDAQALPPMVKRFAMGGTGGKAEELLKQGDFYAGGSATLLGLLRSPGSFISLAEEIVKHM
jgi:hypothetical protein